MKNFYWEQEEIEFSLLSNQATTLYQTPAYSQLPEGGLSQVLQSI